MPRNTKQTVAMNKSPYDKRIAEELADCDAAELQAMLEIIHTTKTVIRKNRKVTYAP